LLVDAEGAALSVVEVAAGGAAPAASPLQVPHMISTVLANARESKSTVLLLLEMSSVRVERYSLGRISK
jgi:hypothetical protein